MHDGIIGEPARVHHIVGWLYEPECCECGDGGLYSPAVMGHLGLHVVPAEYLDGFSIGVRGPLEPDMTDEEVAEGAMGVAKFEMELATGHHEHGDES